MNAENGENQKNKRLHTAAVILLIAAGFLLGLAAGYLSAQKDETYTGGVGFTVVPEQQGGEEYPEQGVTVPGITYIHVSTENNRMTSAFYNPEENSGLYYLKFELRADIDGKREVLYTSGLIEPGKCVYDIKLSRKLEKGVYNAVVHVQPYRINKELTPTNNADIMATIKAE